MGVLLWVHFYPQRGLFMLFVLSIRLGLFFLRSLLLDDGFLFPPAHAVSNGSDDCAHYPADEQGDEQRVGRAGTHSSSFGPGEEFQTIGHWYTDDNCGNNGNP